MDITIIWNYLPMYFLCKAKTSTLFWNRLLTAATALLTVEYVKSAASRRAFAGVLSPAAREKLHHRCELKTAKEQNLPRKTCLLLWWRIAFLETLLEAQESSLWVEVCRILRCYAQKGPVQLACNKLEVMMIRFAVMVGNTDALGNCHNETSCYHT